MKINDDSTAATVQSIGDGIAELMSAMRGATLTFLQATGHDAAAADLADVYEGMETTERILIARFAEAVLSDTAPPVDDDAEEAEHDEIDASPLLNVTALLAVGVKEASRLMSVLLRHVDVDKNKHAIVESISRITVMRAGVAQALADGLSPREVEAFHMLIDFPTNYTDLIAAGKEAMERQDAIERGDVEIEIIAFDDKAAEA